jgi:hypothetical protein
LQNWRVSGLHDDDDRDLTRFLPSFNHPGSVPLLAGEWTFVGPAKAALCLTMFEISINPVQVITVLRGIAIARCINFAKHFVFPGPPVRQALQGCRWSFLCSHDLPESSLLRAESERLRCGESSKSEEVTFFNSCRNTLHLGQPSRGLRIERRAAWLLLVSSEPLCCRRLFASAILASNAL